MTKNQKDVKKFMLGVGQECPDSPTVPAANIRKLRTLLLLEEVLENAEASGVKIFDSVGNQIRRVEDLSFVVTDECNLEKVVDSLVDISYVNDGTALAYGIDLEPFLDIVHENNMLKIETGSFNEDGKLVKHPDHPKPDFKTELDRQIKLAK